MAFHFVKCSAAVSLRDRTTAAGPSCSWTSYCSTCYRHVSIGPISTLIIIIPLFPPTHPPSRLCGLCFFWCYFILSLCVPASVIVQSRGLELFMPLYLVFVTAVAPQFINVPVSLVICVFVGTQAGKQQCLFFLPHLGAHTHTDEADKTHSNTALWLLSCTCVYSPYLTVLYGGGSGGHKEVRISW